MTASASPLSTAQAHRWITPARLAPFHDRASADQRLAADLYIWNARLSSVCMEVIHHVEVLVRNAIHSQLSRDEPTDAVRSWLVNPAVLKAGELRAVEDAGADAIAARAVGPRGLTCQASATMRA